MERIKQLIEALCKGIYEREEVFRLAFLSAVAGESIFLLGPPGVAKSLIARRLKFAFRNGTSFEYLMNKFSTPDEIFGPVSIKKLKDEDKYERLTAKYLPGANVVFLDEIWKAGPSIQNALLTIINEKIYRNGEAEEKVDIKCIISASNELPPSGEGLDALWDRFLVRYTIREIRNSGNFINMIVNTEDVYQDNVPDSIKISNEELAEWDQQIEQVRLPDEVIHTLQMVKAKLEALDETQPEKFGVYDRRWKKIVRLLRTSAFLNQRDQVDLMDCFLMAHCLWSHPSQLNTVQEILAETIRKHGYSLSMNLSSLKREIAELEEEVKKETQIPYTKETELPELIEEEYYEVVNVSQLFEGKYIRSEEYERLKVDELTTIGLYDASFSLTYKIKAKRGAADHSLDIFHSSNYVGFQLRTKTTQKTSYLTKAPHPVIKKYWDERMTQIEDYIAKLNTRLVDEAPIELQHLRNNLFVSPKLSAIVEANMNDSVNTVRSESLKVEKLRFYYQNLEQ